MMTPPAGDGIHYAVFDRVELRGRDAVNFAHAQLASDIQGLPDGGWQWSAYLTPQGRTIALLLALRRSPEAVDLLIPAGRGDELAMRLKRFVFRSKVALRAVPGGARGVADAAWSVATAPTQGAWDADCIALAPGAAVRLLQEVPGDSQPDSALSEVDEQDWRGFLVATGIPLLAAGAVEAFTPHALGLDGLAAISTRKGCYPGQEIVARTHFLGRNKRRLYRYAASTATLPVPGATLGTAGGDAAVATVVLSRMSAVGVEGLLVGHEQLQDARIMLDDAEVRLNVAR